MDALITFLRARLDEREAAAKAMKEVYPTPWDVSDRGWMARVVADGPNFPDVIVLEQNQAPDAGWLSHVIHHVYLNDPDYVLADVAAKRQIIDQWLGEDSHGWHKGYGDAISDVLRLLALPFAGHPDYREEWRVQ